MRSISSADTLVTAKAAAVSVITSKSFSRRRPVSFLESFSPSICTSGGRSTAAA